MTEAAVENPVVARAESAGIFVRKLAWVGRRAAPDRLFAHKTLGGAVFIEFKDKGEKPGMLQKREHELMRAAGLEVHVCDNVDDAMRVLGLRGEPLTRINLTADELAYLIERLTGANDPVGQSVLAKLLGIV